MDEYIKREAAQEALKRFCEGMRQDMPRYPSAIILASKDIDKIPAADVVPVVHGRWIPFEHWVHKTFWKGKACSVCNANIGHKTVFKFCPNCGARMDGE